MYHDIFFSHTNMPKQHTARSDIKPKSEMAKRNIRRKFKGHETIYKMKRTRLRNLEKLYMINRSEQAKLANEICVLAGVPEQNRYDHLCTMFKELRFPDQKEIDDLIGWADIIRQYPNAPQCRLTWDQLVHLGISAKNNIALRALARLPPDVQDKWKTLD